ncbi:hypothetical protein N9L31_00245 [bacterium]|nr:hypothetical protein [bacterium]
MVQSGLDASAADVIVRNHWAPSTNSGLNSIWAQWLKHCDSTGVEVTSPSVGQFINFLQAVSAGTYRSGDMGGVATSAGWVRSVRSGISSMLALMTATPRLGEHPLVTAFVSSLIKQDVVERGKPGVRYDDTWDATLIFDHWMAQPPTSSLSYADLLDKAISLSRIHMCSRSSDLATLWFGQRRGGETIRFDVSPAGVVRSVSVRYFNPKTGRYMANAHGFTSWIEFPVDDDLPAEVSLPHVLHSLFQRIEARGDFHDQPHVFLATRRSASVIDGTRRYFYEGLTADRLASRMKAIMRAAGVPLDFNSHSARAAGGALLKRKGFDDDTIMDRMRLRSKYIYRKHYKRDSRPVATLRHPVAVSASLAATYSGERSLVEGSAGVDPTANAVPISPTPSPVQPTASPSPALRRSTRPRHGACDRFDPAVPGGWTTAATITARVASRDAR